MAKKILSVDTRIIYALRNQETGQVHYVGQTLHPLARLKSHRQGKFKLIAEQCDLWILREAKKPQVNQIELQIVRAFKRRGECELNGSTGRRSMKGYFRPSKEWIARYPNKSWPKRA